MATTYTDNLNLQQPDLDDDALITVINNDMAIIDKAVNGVQDGLAIVANGNTHVAISAGQFVYVRNHTTLTEGLYVASSNIAANATLSTSNLTADSAGGLNALNSKIGAVAFQDLTSIVNVGANVSNVSGKKIYRIGNTVFAFIRCSVSAQDATIVSGLPIAETSNMELMGSNAYMSLGSTTINAVAPFTDKPILIIYSTSN